MSEYTDYLLRNFVKAIPWYIGMWLVVTVVVALWVTVVDREEFGDALRTMITFLPVGIPLTPLIWLRWERDARTPKALPALGIAILWALITLPLAILACVAIGNLIGVD
jgi:hypothetical protein